MLQNWIMSLNYGGATAVLCVILLVFSSYLLGWISLGKILSLKWRYWALEQISFFIMGLNLLMFLSLTAGYSSSLIPGKLLWILIFLTGICGSIVFLKKIMNMKEADFRIRISLFLLISAFSLLTLGSALCFPVGWDELVYHTALPLRWLSDGIPMVYQDNPYSAFPDAPELLFRWLIYAGGIKTPRLLTWFLFIVVIYSLYLLLKPGFSSLRASILTFAFCFSPLTLMLAREAYVEIFILLNLAGGFIVARGLRAVSRKGTAYAAALAVFAGGACSVKMTGGAVFIAIFILLLYLLHGKGIRRAMPAVMLFLICSAVFAAPFYLRAYVGTGNPFHPYFASFFSSNPARCAMSAYHHAIGEAKFGTEGVCAFFSAPLLLSFCKIKTFDGSFGYQFIPLFVLCLCGGVMAFRQKNRYLRTLILMMIFLYVFWFFTSQQARFLYPFFFVSLIMAANSFRFSRVVNVFLIMLILFLSLISIPRVALSHYLKSWKAVVGRVKFMDYLYTGTGKGYLKALSLINEKTPQDARILLLFEKRGLYVPRKYQLGTPFFQEKYFMPFGEGAPAMEKMLKQLKEEGITHILSGNPDKDPDRLPFYTGKSHLLNDVIRAPSSRKNFRIIGEAEGYCIYEIDY
ncbi:MAG: hypothetical protein A2017_04885 [Lentisphaerae bacterium GWF2_44_16]|nr:MAG: hypothetical protein A2017_04885 [Lentisphaerae bacterium GWF2_44_16]